MADNISILDSASAAKVVRTTDNAGVHTPHHNVDALIPGTAATNLGKAIDSAAGATDTGIAALIRRDDALSTVTPVEGDWLSLYGNARGALWTDIDPSGTIGTDITAIKIAVEILDNAISGNEMQVDIVTSALPSGAATETTLSAIQTAVELIDNAISGTEMQVDVVTSALPTGAATETTVDGIRTAVELLDDAIYTDDTSTHSAATSKVFGMGAVATPTDTSVNANDIGMPAMSTDRRLLIDADLTDIGAIATETTLDAIKTAVELIDNCVSGNEMQVDIVSGGGSGTEYTVDAVAPSTPTGTAKLMERDDALSTLTPAEGDWSQQFCNSRGALWTDIDPSGTVGADISAIKDAVQILDNAISGNEMQVDIVTSALPSGAATETTLAAIQTAVELLDNAISGTEMQVDVVAALPAGDNNIGNVDVVTLPALAAGTNNIGDVDIASAIPAGTNVIGDVGLAARTSGGCTPYRNVDVDETEDQVKATAGQIFWMHCMNMTSAVLYLQIYNATAASVTVGTTTPTLTFPIPTLGDTNGAGFNVPMYPTEFSTAITVACTTTYDGSSGPAANGCFLNMGYE